MKNHTLILLALFAFSPSAKAIAPGAAGALSIVPGLGQIVHGDVGSGFLWLGAVVATMASGSSDVRRTGISIWQYNIYDAYQGAGGRDTSKNNVFHNVIGAYNPLNLIDPIGAPQLAANAAVIATSSADTVYRGPRNPLLGTLFQTPNAVAEEALYRGYFFPVLSNMTGSKIVGALSSTVLFHFGHLLYGGYNMNNLKNGMVNNFVNGLLWCWQTNRNQYDLRKSIFTHMWIDAMIYYKWRGSGNSSSGGGGGDGAGPESPFVGLKITYAF